MVSIGQYGDREVEACKRVLVELIHILGEFKDEIVLIGGWAPTFLIPQPMEPHVGSLDIDIAFNFLHIPEDTYRTILETFLKRGYIQDSEQPFRFFRKVAIDEGTPIDVEVDLMAGEYGGAGKSRRTQRVQDVRARKTRGCDLAFDSAISVTLEGELPDGGKDKVIFKVAGIVSFLAMKGMAIYDRMKEKDAYDIFYCIEQYPGGIEHIRAEFKPHMGNTLVVEGLSKIRSKFASIEHVGPKWVADFLEIRNPEDRAITMRRAYEKVKELLDVLEVPTLE